VVEVVVVVLVGLECSLLQRQREWEKNGSQLVCTVDFVEVEMQESLEDVAIVVLFGKEKKMAGKLVERQN
jgi:hypothetical protein